MARVVICLGVFAGALCFAVPAVAQPSGYIAVSKLQIDPRMPTINDGVDVSQAPRGPHGTQAESGVPLDQMGSDDQDQDQDAENGPAGDDPYADNAVQTDTVYTT